MKPGNPSIKNIDINERLVHQLLSAQFPQWEHLSIKPAEFDGWDNRTFRLGENMSVRLPSAEGYAAQVEKEQRWLPKLAPLLPLPIPVPLAMGKPDHNYPWPWSIYQWIEGKHATLGNIADLQEFAVTLAQFLLALQQIDSTAGPPPGQHNFFRGGPLNVYDLETRNAIIALNGKIDTDLVTEVWETSLRSQWHGKPVWLHGDIAPGNLLVKDGRLNAIIDFGCSAVGDPACDLVITWTFFSGASREAFFTALPLDRAMWARARGWALWKALITLAEYHESDIPKSKHANHVINEVLEDRGRAKW